VIPEGIIPSLSRDLGARTQADSASRRPSRTLFDPPARRREVYPPSAGRSLPRILFGASARPHPIYSPKSLFLHVKGLQPRAQGPKQTHLRQKQTHPCSIKFVSATIWCLINSARDNCPETWVCSAIFHYSARRYPRDAQLDSFLASHPAIFHAGPHRFGFVSQFSRVAWCPLL